jgi:hypothetical protein
MSTMLVVNSLPPAGCLAVAPSNGGRFHWRVAVSLRPAEFPRSPLGLFALIGLSAKFLFLLVPPPRLERGTPRSTNRKTALHGVPPARQPLHKPLYFQGIVKDPLSPSCLCFHLPSSLEVR